MFKMLFYMYYTVPCGDGVVTGEKFGNTRVPMDNLTINALSADLIRLPGGVVKFVNIQGRNNVTLSGQMVTLKSGVSS